MRPGRTGTEAGALDSCSNMGDLSGFTWSNAPSPQKKAKGGQRRYQAIACSTIFQRRLSATALFELLAFRDRIGRAAVEPFQVLQQQLRAILQTRVAVVHLKAALLVAA